jgi:hypothetical protein
MILAPQSSQLMKSFTGVVALNGTGTKTAVTFTGAAIVESIALYVSEDGAGMDNISVVTSHTNEQEILTEAEGATANLLVQKNLAFAYSRFPIYFETTQHLDVKIAGTGTKGILHVAVTYRAAVTGQAVSAA